jgi:dolichol-phosphate mannosyltransferase
MPTIIINGLAGKLPPLVGPNVARDYVSADDCVEAYLRAATTKTEDPGAVYNVGSQEQTSLAQVVDVARKVLNITEQPNWGSMPNRKWDTSVWVSNSEKIKAELGWQARDSFEQGFEKMVAWFNQNPKTLKFYREKINAVATSR